MEIFKGFKQIKGFGDGFSEDVLENGYLYLIRTSSENNDEGYIYFNGRKYGLSDAIDLSNLVTFEEFEPVSEAALNSITKGTLGKINGISLEDNDVTLDLSLYKIVSALPTENIQENKIYLMLDEKSTSEKNIFDEYIYIISEDGNTWEQIGQLSSNIDLSDYLKSTDAEKLYVKKSENQNSNVGVDDKGAMSNFSDNGQAYLAIRPKTANFIVNYAFAAAAFGVKDDGTAAFSHKKYDTYDKNTGKSTGAKNTAVLQFAGPVGLRYGKNTGTSNDVTQDMYRYVGVIDSPDEFQRVYSAKQVDDLLKPLQDEIEELKKSLALLAGVPAE